jgi:hypothetical protein
MFSLKKAWLSTYFIKNIFLKKKSNNIASEGQKYTMTLECMNDMYLECKGYELMTWRASS